MSVLYCVTERMPDGFTLVENATRVEDGDDVEIHFTTDDILLRAEDKSQAYDFMAVGIIKSILERTNDLAALYVIVSQKLYHQLTGLGENDFRTK